MSQALIAVFLNGWLVIAVALFGAIVFAVFRPSARQRMNDHARSVLEEAPAEEGAPR